MKVIRNHKDLHDELIDEVRRILVLNLVPELKSHYESRE